MIRATQCGRDAFLADAERFVASHPGADDLSYALLRLAQEIHQGYSEEQAQVLVHNLREIVRLGRPKASVTPVAPTPRYPRLYVSRLG